jgi:polysaccharide biosynthesis/export protein
MTALCCLASAQESARRDPGAPLNYSPLKWFATNYQQQTAYFMRFPGTSPDYRIGQGDVLTVEVVGEDSLRQTLRVNNTGEITLPQIGIMLVTGLTAAELESRISRRLAQLELLRNPEVLVYIEAYESKRIYVIGEVDNPGEYVMTQDLTLMDAIFMAGGIDFTADRYGYLHRRPSGGSILPPPAVGPPGTRARTAANRPQSKVERAPQALIDNPGVAAPGSQVIQVDLQPLKEGGVLKDNIPLQRGDVFVVPRRTVRMFYVIGDVRTPGPYELPPPVERSILASQAISWAGGPGPTAKLKNGLLVRYLENGQRQESKVDFKAIMIGKQKDLEIRPDDIIFIPGSKMKTLTYGMMGAVPGMVQSAVIFQTVR